MSFSSQKEKELAELVFHNASQLKKLKTHALQYLCGKIWQN